LIFWLLVPGLVLFWLLVLVLVPGLVLFWRRVPEFP
jgi:hypothetical protein